MVRKNLFPRIQIEGIDTHAHYIWILRARRLPLKRIYMVGRYFPSSSSYEIQDGGDSPYLGHFPEITKYFAKDEIFLMGDFNSRIGNSHTQYYDRNVDSLHIQTLDRPLLL